MSDLPDDSRQILRSVEAGDERARERLVQIVYDQLHGMAQRLLGERPGATLQPTELIHEAWLRLSGDQDGDGEASYESLRHYRRVATRAMRYVLVDRARARLSKKRGGSGRPVTLDEDLMAAPVGADDATLSVHEGLERLAEVDPELAQLVELRFFGGFTMPEIARNFGVSERTAHRMWRLSRAWWLEQFSDSQDP